MDQMSLFDTVSDSDVLKELQELEVSTMTPLDALNTLYRSAKQAEEPLVEEGVLMNEIILLESGYASIKSPPARSSSVRPLS